MYVERIVLPMFCLAYELQPVFEREIILRSQGKRLLRRAKSGLLAMPILNLEKAILARKIPLDKIEQLFYIISGSRIDSG
ncbi:MAG: hypothetical protein A2Z45_01695 [Chloroflexi bacterium RBG_19FT_COMBO_55_16]|nr:MAG: hypothetical protein A2Z45_01695 [Chloroflexi bacterium RBG_19FT_COMBO_55_16]